MDVKAFENLGLLPEMLKEIKQLREFIYRRMSPVTTKKEVAKLLNVTPRTINNYISEGLLKEGYHFKRKNAKVLVFIEDAIFDFRDERSKGMVNGKIAI